LPRERLALGGILLLAALLRIIPLGVITPRSYQLDERNFAHSAQQMWAERTLDPQRYIHPALYRYLTALLYPAVSTAVEIGGAERLERWVPYIAGRIVSAAAGVLTVWLVYVLGRRIMGRGGGMWAALLLAVMPIHVRFSHVAKPDVTMAMWVALTLLLAWRLTESPAWRLYALAGFVAGLAVSSKYNGVVACVPLLAAHLLARREQSVFRRLLAGRLWLAAGCSILGFALTSPYTLIRYQAALRSAATGYHRLMVAGRADLEMGAQMPALVDFAILALEWVGPLVVVLVPVGLWLWWRRNRRGLAVVGAVLAAGAVLIAGWTVRRAFYLLPLVPAVALGAAAPLAEARSRRRRLGLVLAALAVVPSFTVSVREVVRLARRHTRQLAQAWLASNLGRYGRILRDYDSLTDDAHERFRIANPGFDFYKKADRDYLRREGITHLVLSNSVASTAGLTSKAARRKRHARQRLLDCAEPLARIPTSWWRDGPAITIYRLRPSLLRQFAHERRQRRSRLLAQAQAAEQALVEGPATAPRHMKAGRLLCRVARLSNSQDALAALKNARGHFQQAAALEPDLADAHYNLGCVHLRIAELQTASGQGGTDAFPIFGRAARAFRRAIEADPTNADYYYNLGYALFCWGTRNAETWKMRQEEGKRMFRKAAALKPDLRIPDFHVLAVIEAGARPLH
jgi:4-amino-4-deoxy-L-arabinose transferase-like glycosyltransferase